MEARSPFFESQVYKSYALQKIKKVLRLEGAKLTYRKDECDDAEEGHMRLTAQSTVTATINMHRKRQGKHRWGLVHAEFGMPSGTGTAGSQRCVT